MVEARWTWIGVLFRLPQSAVRSSSVLRAVGRSARAAAMGECARKNPSPTNLAVVACELVWSGSLREVDAILGIQTGKGGDSGLNRSWCEPVLPGVNPLKESLDQ